MKLRILYMLFACLIVVSCKDSTTEVVDDTENGDYFTISGTISNPNNHDIPSGSRLVLIWSGDGSGYVWGQGELVNSKKGFEFKLDKSTMPPIDILLDSDKPYFGLATLCLVSEYLPDGKIDNFNKIYNNLIAYVPNKSVIYRDGLNSEFEQYSLSVWLNDFNNGYTIGTGIEMQSGFDHWGPDASTGLKMEFQEDIGDISDNMPNWC